MSESHERPPEVGKAKRESLLVRGRKLLGGFMVFGGGSAALIGLDSGADLGLVGVGALVAFAGGLLSEIIELPKRK